MPADRRARASAFTLAALLIASLAWLATRDESADAPISAPAAGCLACHDGPSDDPGGLHAASVMGCEVCHGGDPGGTNVLEAHRGLELEPGALDSVATTCGGCHPTEMERVAGSLMATGRGLIAVDRHAFGELPHPDGDQTFASLLALESPSPSEDHLRRLCAGCHLGTRRQNRDDSVIDGGSGCGACHVGTTPEGGHPSVDLHVPDDRCLGCHSRSSRLSLSYQGLAEIGEDARAGCEEPVTLFDGRTGCRVAPDVHHEARMECIDCHLHTELMGDGLSHAHAEDAVELRCESCHGPVSAAEESVWAEVDDPIAIALLRLRGEERSADEAIRLGRRGTPLWNVRPGAGERWLLHRKADGVALAIAPTPGGVSHRRAGHERLTCTSCHSAWAPRCPTCHTRFDAEGEQWDFGVGALSPGAWVETNEGMGFGEPSLGVRPDGRIEPAIPGMIAELEGPEGSSNTLRLFSTLDPHTTSRRGRSCASCHADPLALGLGSGRLEHDEEGWRFIPSHPSRDDPSLAMDAWTSLTSPQPGSGTRRGARSLDRGEIVRILFVGLCLQCHDEESAIFEDFERSALRMRGDLATGCEFAP